MNITKREVATFFSNLKELKKKKIALNKERKEAAKKLKQIEEQYTKTSFLISIIQSSELINGTPINIEKTKTIHGFNIVISSSFFPYSPLDDDYIHIKFNNRCVQICTNANNRKYYGIRIGHPHLSSVNATYLGSRFKNLKEITEAAKQYVATGKKINVAKLAQDKRA